MLILCLLLFSLSVFVVVHPSLESQMLSLDSRSGSRVSFHRCITPSAHGINSRRAVGRPVPMVRLLSRVGYVRILLLTLSPRLLYLFLQVCLRMSSLGLQSVERAYLLSLLLRDRPERGKGGGLRVPRAWRKRKSGEGWCVSQRKTPALEHQLRTCSTG